MEYKYWLMRNFAYLLLYIFNYV